MEVRKLAKRALPALVLLSIGGLATSCSEGAQDQVPSCPRVADIEQRFGIDDVRRLGFDPNREPSAVVDCRYRADDISVSIWLNQGIQTYDNMRRNERRRGANVRDLTENSYVSTEVFHDDEEVFGPDGRPEQAPSVTTRANHRIVDNKLCGVHVERYAVNLQDDQAGQQTEEAVIALANNFCRGPESD